MGFLYQFGRILLGFLMIISGLMIFKDGYKDHLQSFKHLRTHIVGHTHVHDVIKASA